jgi:transposase InsO family protein/transposase-like protein
MYEQRLALIHRIVTLKQSVGQVAKEFGVSRKTAHKWLARYRREESLADQSRRPGHSPGKTCEPLEAEVLDIRQRFNWGPRKIHRILCNRHNDAGETPLSGVAASTLLSLARQKPSNPSASPAAALGGGVACASPKVTMPCLRTVARILSRNGCAGSIPPTVSAPPQFFERAEPNQLWQLDHKGPIEVARQRVWPLSVLDDYSRYCLCFQRTCDTSHQTTWELLWELFDRYGLPESILCDNAFSASVGLSWFDARLVRLAIDPIHGRSYHPQTQGKVERFNGTAKRELIDFGARRDSFEHFDEDAERFRMTYNTIRPHEALGDLAPITRWKTSVRARPRQIPEVIYPSGSVMRKVSQVGDFHYRNARILVGRALSRQHVRIEEREHDIAVYYSWKLVRVIPHDKLGVPRSQKDQLI